MEEAYLIIDIGTGNTRVGLFNVKGKEICIYKKDTKYTKDKLYKDAFNFNPTDIWEDIKNLIQKCLGRKNDVKIKAVISTSQRQGIILIDKAKKSFLGLPNIDNRGEIYEENIKKKEKIYRLSGRWPNRYFPAIKLYGLRERESNKFNRIDKITSISDWIGYKFTGRLTYEPSQACETLLFDIKRRCWSKELCELLGIDINILPPILNSGEKLANIKDSVAKEIGLDINTPFIIGGGDTQMAVKGAGADIFDMVIISGTTTPIIQLVDNYYYDEREKFWLNIDLDKNKYIIETNAGITGLNYQRLRKNLFPHYSFQELDKKMKDIKKMKCLCTLSNMDFDEKRELNTGAFLINLPISEELKIEDIAYSILFSIACGIRQNYDNIKNITNFKKEYIIGCGGGFSGIILPQLVANLLNKKIILKESFSESSIIGGVGICNEYFKINNLLNSIIKEFKPRKCADLEKMYNKWLELRKTVNRNEYSI